jgi:hypothetical protein
MRFAPVFVLLMLLQLSAFGQERSENPQLTERLRDQIQYALKWSAFWQPGLFVNYVAGEALPVKIVASRREVVVFLTKIRVQVVFRRSGPNDAHTVALVGGLSRLGNETPDSDLHSYIQMQSIRSDPGTMDRSARASGKADMGSGTVVPAQRMYLGSGLSPEMFSVGEDVVHLPVLTPPEYLETRTPPSGLDRFIAAVSEEVRKYLAADRQPATVVIPYFSEADPLVYVYVDFHEPESRGILHMVHDDANRWVNGMLKLDRGPNNFDSLIGKVRSLRMVELSVGK